MIKRRRRFLGWVAAIAMGALLAGCGAEMKNIAPPDDFLTGRAARVGLIWTTNLQTEYPEGPERTAKFFIIGNQGLLDIAVARAFSDEIRDAMRGVSLDEMMEKHYFGVFQPAFERYDFTVKVQTEPYCWKKFRLGENEYCTRPLAVDGVDLRTVGMYPFPDYRYDYAPVYADLDVDFLMVVHLLRAGTGRSYYAMIPTSPPQGVATIIAYLIERESGKVISQHMSSVVEPVKGEWDQPPDYENLIAAAKTSFQIAMDEVFIEIFQEAP